jgi:hypothetical protein
MIRALADFADLGIGERPSKREGNQIFPSETGAQRRHEPEFGGVESHQIESLKHLTDGGIWFPDAYQLRVSTIGHHGLRARTLREKGTERGGSLRRRPNCRWD